MTAAGTLLRALRPGSRAIVRVIDRDADGKLAVVDAATLGRARTIPQLAVRPEETLYRARAPRSGYAPVDEATFVYRLLDTTISKVLGTGDHETVVSPAVREPLPRT
ncbi:hypothetical protein DBP19_36655 [Streptomyces sp. CS090A]|uniref:hypothetical protein n=1 Tax=Streptomyces sp. CS090A TaxID=2162710 RepID=UPI000D50EFFD|nr:hypothetical protein [Streptomyces sp. CS090A]PVC80385.1 hypothetical protein DBP19_36655 [Streptomyces sp. CS090A]